MSRNRGDQHKSGFTSSPDRQPPVGTASATLIDDPPSPSPASRRSARILPELIPGRRIEEEDLLRSPLTRGSALQLTPGPRQTPASTSTRRQLTNQRSQHPASSHQHPSAESASRFQEPQEAVRRSPRLAGRAAQQHTLEPRLHQRQGEYKRQRTSNGKGASLSTSCSIESLRDQEQRVPASRAGQARKEIKVKGKGKVIKMDRLAAVRSSRNSSGSSTNASHQSSSSSGFSPFSDGSLQPSTSGQGVPSTAFGDPASDPSSALLQNRMPLQEIPLWLADSRGELLRRRSPAAGWASSTGNGSFEEVASSSVSLAFLPTFVHLTDMQHPEYRILPHAMRPLKVQRRALQEEEQQGEQPGFRRLLVRHPRKA